MQSPCAGTWLLQACQWAARGDRLPVRYIPWRRLHLEMARTPRDVAHAGARGRAARRAGTHRPTAPRAVSLTGTAGRTIRTPGDRSRTAGFRGRSRHAGRDTPGLQQCRECGKLV
jgi:hypothetical protein